MKIRKNESVEQGVAPYGAQGAPPVNADVGAKGKPAYPFGVLQLVFQVGYALARLPCTLAGRRTQRLDGKPLLAAFAPPGLRAG